MNLPMLPHVAPRLRLALQLPAGLLLTALALGFAPGCEKPFSNCQETLSCGGAGGEDGNASGAAPSSGGSGGLASVCDEACSQNDNTPFCSDTLERCVACRDNDDCSSPKSVCNPKDDTYECVECVQHSDCTDPTAPLCAGNKCVPCGSNSDCDELNLNVCQNDGSCVECVTADDCKVGSDLFVCAPNTNTCTATKPNSLFACDECAHDLDCQVGQLCVTQVFESATIGNFCTWTKAGRPATASGSCNPNGKPFAGFAAAATSVDGATADLCVLRKTTCPGYLDYLQVVDGCEGPGTQDSACGAANVSDGLCRNNTESDPFCTYPCSINADCAGSASCVGAPDGYCSLD